MTPRCTHSISLPTAESQQDKNRKKTKVSGKTKAPGTDGIGLRLDTLTLFFALLRATWKLWHYDLNGAKTVDSRFRHSD